MKTTVLIGNSLIIAALSAIVGGIFWIYAPFGVVVGGVVMLWIGVSIARGRGGNEPG